MTGRKSPSTWFFFVRAVAQELYFRCLSLCFHVLCFSLHFHVLRACAAAFLWLCFSGAAFRRVSGSAYRYLSLYFRDANRVMFSFCSLTNAVTIV